jgi:hypothetical protein
MSYKINLVNHWKALDFFIVSSILILLGCAFIGWNSEGVLFVLVFYFILSLPSFYLHLEYYFKNRGQRLEVLSNVVIFHDRDGQIRKFGHQDLQKIVLYKSASLDKGGIPLTPLESYHYARIVPKQGEDIILTCLMAADVEQVIKQIKWMAYERKKRLFASLNFSFRLLPDR